MTADHLQDRGTGAEGAAAATPVAKGNTEEVWDRTWELGNLKAGARSERPKAGLTLKSHIGLAREMRDEK